MKLSKRICLHLVRYKRKNMLFFWLVFLISLAVMLSLGMQKTQSEKSEELKGATGSSFTLSRNLATGGWASDKKHGSYSTAEFVTDEMLKKIGKKNGISGYNASNSTILSLIKDGTTEITQVNSRGIPDIDNQFYAQGCNDSKFQRQFQNQSLVLVAGRHLRSTDQGEILISKELAKKENLAVGNKISAVNDPYNNDPTVELEIVGIFESQADQTDEKNNYDMASFFDHNSNVFVSNEAMSKMLANYKDVSSGYESADFFVENPEQLEKVIQDIQKDDSVNWENFKISTNDEVFERTSENIRTLEDKSSKLIMIAIPVSAVLIIIVLFMWVDTRIKETGLYLSMGITKMNILCQFAFEIIIVSSLSFSVALASSKIIQIVSPQVKILREFVTADISFRQIISIYITGSILIIIALLVTMIPIFRMKPKSILSLTE